MTQMLALPDWLPWWLLLLILVPVLLYLVIFLVMPFSVFGVKGRLSLIDARLDELQGEIRTLALRLREPVEPQVHAAPRRAAGDRPPIPPGPPPRAEEEDWEEPPPQRETRRTRPPGARAEPRLDWPR